MKSTVASLMFRLAYGYQLQGKHDPIFRNVQQAVHRGTMAVMFTSERNRDIYPEAQS